MSRFQRTRRLRAGLVLGLAALVLASAPGALGSAAKPPPKPPAQPPGHPGGSPAGNQYAPPQSKYGTTARARAIGLCKKAVAKQLAAKLSKCKNAKCRRNVQRQSAAAKQQCNKLGSRG